jgi:uncharacterized protein YcaQ
MTERLRISKQAARRFVLGKQGLWPGRRFAGKPGTRDAVVACEHLQLDPLVIVARSHDLMLHARVADYRPEYFGELAYDDRHFFDWGGWLAVRPMEELPHWRVLMRRDRESRRIRAIAEEHGPAVDEMRRALHERATVSGREFAAAERRAVDSYRGSKDSSLALYYLWRTGEAMTHHREGFERVYSRTELIAPPRLIAETTDAAADRFMTRKAVAFAGIGRPGPLSRVLSRKVTKLEEQALERELVDAGVLTDVEVADAEGAGANGRQFVLTEDRDALDDVARGHVPKAWAALDTTTDDEVVLLSPLDPVSARGRAKALFDVDYVWEIYKRPADVVFGRFTMPILWGDRIVGRIDLKHSRPTRTLVINGLWFESKADARQPQLRGALQLGLGRAKALLRAERVEAGAVTDAKLRRHLAAS